MIQVAYKVVFATNTRLVKQFVGYGRSQRLTFLELLQEGQIGLMKGITRFNVRKGYKPSTYLARWIKAEIRRVLLDKERLIRIPDNVHTDLRALRGEVEHLRELFGRQPTDQEIADSLEIPVTRIIELREIGSDDVSSLDMKIGDSDDGELHDLIAHPDTVESQVSSLTETSEEYQIVQQQLSTLDPTHRVVFGLLHGLDVDLPGYDDILRDAGTTFLKPKQVAELLGISIRAVIKLEKEALEVLGIPSTAFPKPK